jgi:hypothetical protein
MCSLNTVATKQKACQIIVERFEKGLDLQAAIVKALAVLFLWFVNTSTSKGDIMTFAEEWWGEEGGIEKVDKTNTCHYDEATLLRFSRIFSKSDQLKASLQKLHILVHLHDPKIKSRVDELDSALASIVQGSDNGTIANFSQLVDYHFFQPSLTGERQEVQDPLVQKKRKLRTDRPMRSRNRIVDAWLKLDQEMD